jgi:NAD(P)-dependent dehydrogenase (short-subunit alcohol dehydrogenase family)
VTARILDNRVALITGAGRGIGRAIALGFAREGARIAAVARTVGELTSLEHDIDSLGSKCVSIPADLADPATPAQVVQKVLEALGTIDILVNNAGAGSSLKPSPLVHFDDDFWNYSLALNLSAPYHFCKAVVPILQKKGSGRILNIASIVAKIGLVDGVAYSVSKHGLLGLTRCLALELAGNGITVNAICPGPVRTVLNEARIRYDANRLGIGVEELESRITPIGRRLEPEEIVPTALLLVSDGAAAITGQAFNVCGGVVMS